VEESELMPGPYEGHDCFPSDEPTDVVALVGGERVIAVSYEIVPDVAEVF
jgi:hypothetical protein